VANTQSKEVNLTKRVQTSKGLRYCTVALSANGRVKPDLVIVNGQQERHSEGGTISNGVRMADGCVCRLGRMRPTPSARRQRKEAELNATNKVNEIFA
jgi:hypothetical protein